MTTTTYNVHVDFGYQYGIKVYCSETVQSAEELAKRFTKAYNPKEVRIIEQGTIVYVYQNPRFIIKS